MNERANPVTSIIVTCKDRLHHLQQTLPRMLAQSHAEVVVVDYGCRQDTRGWMRANHPAARVIAVDDDPVFSVSRARNLGAAAARGQFLLFADADVSIDIDLGEWIAGNAHDDHFYRQAPPIHLNSVGTVVCAKPAFAKTGGYDEAYRGWGGEDSDFYACLELNGCQPGFFPAGALTPIEHPDSERLLGAHSGGMDTRLQAVRTHLLYRTIKLDLFRLGLHPDLPFRNQLMTLVKDTVRQYDDTGQQQEKVVTVNVPAIPGGDASDIARTLVYRLPPAGS